MAEKLETRLKCSDPNLCRQGCAYYGVTLYAVMILLMSACVASGGQRLTLDTRDVPAVEYLPDEVTLMLEDLGYEELPESRAQRMAQSFDDYKLQFKARDVENIHVDVDFKLIDKLTRMHLYNIDEKTPSAATIQRFDALKRRVQRQFGVDSVK